ncbi:methyl-accepting chemotaxis sensory transducer with Cache sensor [Thermanaerovibrio acidaminovorans DSM 6589]|uniref:Methyl-accepting chemotaxis sensory transducer with Cache sensor n=2 Tax=Thermanaerovibrio TaxID=81461 RepID=D1B8F7_THEAS|nr:methyl-accepting chemotaxis protein [Thermanaerovibrio acidaminovorans]ACZ18560.1 methyl-accepting chemotaxis sensory transducer with Cache sensor [Thermanaerovibrio acidaminovorans DSM 6589]
MRDLSIAKKLTLLGIGVTVLLGLMVAMVALQSHSILNDQVNTLGMEMIANNANQVDQYFSELKTLTLGIASGTAELLETGQAVTDDDLESVMARYFNATAKDLNILDMYVGLESTGKVGTGGDWVEKPDYDARKRPWYIQAVQEDKVILTAPYVDANTGGLVITVATPVKSTSGKLLGVAGIDVDLKTLSDMITSYKVFGKGYGFLLDREGNTICHPKSEMIMKENITKPSGLITPELAEAGRKMISGSPGFVDYSFQGELRRTFFSPTRSGFVLGVVFPASDLNAMVRSLAIRQLLLGLVTLILVGAMLYGLSRSVVAPVKRITDSLKKLGQLDLTQDQNDQWLREVGHHRTEIGLMAQSALVLKETLRQAISDIASQSDRTAAAAENLAALSEESVASVEEIKASVDQVASLMESNSASLQETNAGIEEVSSGAQQAANSATDGAEAASKMSHLSEQTVRQVEEVVKAITHVGDESKRTFERIQKVADSVASISGFVATIRSIADQTNLLALNAAIEAARAGEAGRGFAVVAEEVRKLAEESAQAAKEVEDLIAPLQANTEESLRATEQSQRSMDDTVRRAHEAQGKLAEVLGQIRVINDAMQNIAATSEEQAAAAQEIAQGIDNATQGTINVVNSVEMIRHSSEETAKASEAVAQEAQALSHTAEQLKALIAKFRYQSSSLSLGDGR